MVTCLSLLCLSMQKYYIRCYDMSVVSCLFRTHDVSLIHPTRYLPIGIYFLFPNRFDTCCRPPSVI